ncbi:hypothetical protein FQA39_LY11627 [Lamprigera yunnana]|nr:hypothetical protein FQA39_LY11627 [Lamprigera yunnana]
MQNAENYDIKNIILEFENTADFITKSKNLFEKREVKDQLPLNKSYYSFLSHCIKALETISTDLIDVFLFSMLFISLFILSSIFSSESTSSTVNKDGWRWLWTCDVRTEKCVRKPEPISIDKKIESLQHTSLAACRLTCGQYGALWPKPTGQMYLIRQLLPFHPNAVNFEIPNDVDEANEFLVENTKIFRNNLFMECGINCSSVSNFAVTIFLELTSVDLTLRWNTNESYRLDVLSKGNQMSIKIVAENVFGIRHGLETLTQLVASYPIYQTNGVSSGLVIVAGAKIQDKPVFRHRGLLLDTARNYLPIDAIKRQINAMAASKLNVLHWHATDSQSFPLVLPKVPQMAKYGAYSSMKVYHSDDVRHLIKYAKVRGVRIILEMDAPSHVGNGWQWGQEANLGNLAVCVNKMPWRQYCIQPPCGQLNPVNKHVFAVLENIYRDLINIFQEDETFHMGGDEVHFGCWNSTEEIINYFNYNQKNRTVDNFLRLWGEYQINALKTYDNVVKHKNTQIIVWSSALTDVNIINRYMPNDRYIIQTWVPSNDNLSEQLLQLGYKVIISTKDAWYLDHGFWGTTLYHGWRTAYANRLQKHENVLGGEVCMWGELVDENSLDNRIWPRAAAAAERLWSNPESGTAAAETRLYRHRERLVTRGVQAEALAPKYCYQNEGECV